MQFLSARSGKVRFGKLLFAVGTGRGAERFWGGLLRPCIEAGARGDRLLQPSIGAFIRRQALAGKAAGIPGQA